MTKKDFKKQHSFFTDKADNAPQKETTSETKQQTMSKVSDGYKPAYIEVKSKRVQLVFQPSLYEKAKIKASNQDISLNEYIHRLIDADTQ